MSAKLYGSDVEDTRDGFVLNRHISSGPRAFNSDHVGTEHLLLSLVNEDTRLAAQALGSLGVTFQTVHTSAAKTIGFGQRRQRGIVTPLPRKVLQLSEHAANLLGHNDVGTELLLLGVIAAEDSGLTLLTSLTGLSNEELGRHVLDYFAAHPAPGQAGTGERTFLTPESVKRLTAPSEQVTNEVVQPLVWRGAFSDQELDKALPPGAHWHEHAFSDATHILWLVSVSPVAVEVTAHDGKKWQHGLGQMTLLEGKDFTAVLRRVKQRAAPADHMLSQRNRRPKMFERFTSPARKTIVLAQEQARAFNTDHIGTEHLLLSLVYDDTSGAAQSLGSLGITFQTVHTAVAETTGVGQRPQGHIPFTPAAKTALELSLREADQLGHDWIGTEHLLLGVIAAADSGLTLLTSLTGLSSDELSRQVLDYLAAHPPPEQAGMGELTFVTPGSVKHISLTAEQLSLIADAAIKAKTSIDAWITHRLLAAARAETSTGE
jgi:ATP-dependent Clp protease ATP-binding subunit ClpA